MITIFNRKTVFKDSSAEAAAAVWSALKKNGIEYEMKTLKNHSSFGRNLHYNQARSYASGGMGAAPFADTMQYVYVIYVKAADEGRALKIIRGQ